MFAFMTFYADKTKSLSVLTLAYPALSGPDRLLKLAPPPTFCSTPMTATVIGEAAVNRKNIKTIK